MPTRDDLRAAVAAAVDRRADAMVRIARHVLGAPETGFREVKTSTFIAQQMQGMGIPFRHGLALTGIKGMLSGGSPGPTVAVIGELDSLVSREHPHADPATGAAHACGHHAQLGILMGVAMGLVESGMLGHLSGRVALVAVPAEEYIEIEYRMELRRQGKIEFLGGKPELIRLGEFDDVDMALMTHTTSDLRDGDLALSGTNNGTVAKSIQFIGRAAHAGAAPHAGVNALNAAMLALSAIHANRETFRDEDTVRVHPIITRGGEAVNAVPADVRMETFVRARTMEAIRQADARVDRAIRAGALAVGAKVRIATLPGYLPLHPCPELSEVYCFNAEAVVGRENVRPARHRTASTDMGDVSHIMPAIHPYAGGAVGNSHGPDYVVEDYQKAVVNPAWAMALTVTDLLADGAAVARRVLGAWKPPLTREGYLALMRGFTREDEYTE